MKNNPTNKKMYNPFGRERHFLSVSGNCFFVNGCMRNEENMCASLSGHKKAGCFWSFSLTVYFLLPLFHLLSL